MSKMDNLRALREARYEQDRAARTGTAAAPAVQAAPAGTSRARTPAKPRAARKQAVEPGGAATEAACGHRAISGRTCTRPAGHAEKNHRYA